MTEPRDLAGTSVEPLGAASGAVANDMVRGSLWTMVAAAVGIPTAFVVNLITARALDPVGLGRLATYVAVLSLLDTGLNLGVAQATVQWLAESRSRGFSAERLHLLRNCVGYHAFAQGPAMAIAAFLLLRHDPLWEGALCAVGTATVQVFDTGSVVLSGTAQNELAAKLLVVAGVLTQAGTVSAAVTTHSASATFSIQIAAGAVGPILSFLFLRRQDRAAFRRPLLLRHLPPGWIRYALGACGASILGALVFGRSEILILQANHLGVQAGLFAVSTGLAGQITVPMDSLMGPLLPTAAGVLAEGPGRAGELANRTLRATSLLGAYTLASVVPAMAIAIPTVFGHRFLRAEVPFLALGFVSCLQSVAVPLSMIVLATRRTGGVFVANLAAVAVDAALAVCLIPFVGIWGAVIANGSSQLLCLSLLAATGVRRGIDLRGVTRACAPFLAGLLGAVTLVVTRLTPSPQVGRIVCAAVVGAAVTSIVLRCRPGWRMGDRDATLIEEGLPGRLRRPYRMIGRVLVLFR